MGSQNLSDWLSGLDEEPGLELDPDILRASQRAPFPSPQNEEPAKKEVPDWLSGLDNEKESDADSWQPPASTPDLQPVSIAPSDPLPDWLADSESADSGDDDDDLPPWLHREKYEEEGVPALAKPTSPTDWQPVESKQPVQQAPQQKVTQSIPTPSPMNVEKKKSAPKQAKPKKLEVSSGVGMLSQAKAELDRGDIPEALLHYGKLIKRGKNLEEIIRDLSDSLYRYPVEVNIWQALGDAYMRANRLKEALDAYNKAEELIR
jgi:tetratricopeptide (TPR) repeat protein